MARGRQGPTGGHPVSRRGGGLGPGVRPTAIPLPELPEHLGELDQSKIVVTACPLKDRAIIAMVYLRSKDFDARYLKDGLLGLAEHLRGDRAREFIEKRKP